MCLHLSEPPTPLKCFIFMVASVLKDPTILIVTLFCGRVLSERAPKCGSGRIQDLGAQREEVQRALHETTHLAEARLVRHPPPRSMPSQALKDCKIQSRRDAPKVAILEAPCTQHVPGRSTLRPPEVLLPRNPTWDSSHLSGLTRLTKLNNTSTFTWVFAP